MSVANFYIGSEIIYFINDTQTRVEISEGLTTF